MEQRLSLVTLGVADLRRARAFYTHGLGWVEAQPSNESVVFYQLGGIVLGLYGREALATDAGLDAEGSGFRGAALAYNTRTREEVDGVLSEAERAGGTLVKPAEDVFWGGYSGYFSDPDGHLWEVAWNPFATLDDAGNFFISAD
ncbi:MAG: VOC family protein [Alphaproteobacteria bacterium]|nr:VOC family protein [Alphaproteobacteria bacterium]